MTYQNSFRELYRNDFREFLGKDYNINLFWKGRVALYAILKALGIKEGNEIILPAFTCVAVAAPITYLKAKPVYVDINPNTFNIDPLIVRKNITSKTKFILTQNTFGLSSDMDQLIELADKHKIELIEDCSHGIGSKYKGKVNGTFTRVSFFSSQWNKMYSTGIGGMTATKDPELTDKLSWLESQAAEPGTAEKLSLKSLLLFRKYLGSGAGYFYLQNVYRFLSRHNLVVGSNQGKEFAGTIEPKNYLKRISELQAKLGSRNIKDIQKNIANRQSTASRYREIFRRLGMELWEPGPDYEHVYIKFSFLVDDKKAFLKNAEKENLEMSDWFVSPVHDVVQGIEKWGYKWGSNPVAEKASRHIVNLPTHGGIDGNFLDKTETFLKKNRQHIIPDLTNLK